MMMRYVIIRDDDTNSTTPIEYLDTLYRPFLEKGMPINLAVIPCVNTDARLPNGQLEVYLDEKKKTDPHYFPIAENSELVNYLKSNPGYCIAQHGCYHDYFEFQMDSVVEIQKRLDKGLECLKDAGFGYPSTFVAPQDVLSKNALIEVAKRFRIISKHWYDLSMFPVSSWFSYILKKKVMRQEHWWLGQTLFLSKPRPTLSEERPLEGMFEKTLNSIKSRKLTVVSTHWWSFFRKPEISKEFIGILHQLGEELHRDPEIRVISFDDLLDGSIV